MEGREEEGTLEMGECVYVCVLGRGVSAFVRVHVFSEKQQEGRMGSEHTK